MADPDREIERKFLLDQPPEDLDDHPRTKIRQGYLAITEGGTEVRVRKEGRRHLLTIKEGHSQNRGQVEAEISPAQFASLWPLTRGRRIRKLLYEVPYDGRVIQVDLYRRKLNGLVTAEVEFSDEDAASRFHAPDWLGREVTGDEQ